MIECDGSYYCTAEDHEEWYLGEDEPPCPCWCEMCGCHGYCDQDDDYEEDEN